MRQPPPLTPEHRRALRALPVLEPPIVGVLPQEQEETPAEVVRLGPRASDGSSLQEWMSDEVARARSGDRFYFRVPLVFKSDGWGCLCPDTYVGTSPGFVPNVQGPPYEASTWVRVENASGAEFPVPPSRLAPNTAWLSGAEGPPGYRVSEGMVVRVDGYFTGITEEADFDGEPYSMSVFRVTRIHRIVDPSRAEHFRVGYLGAPAP